jgi:anti-anti-sigma regulatory factor
MFRARGWPPFDLWQYRWQTALGEPEVRYLLVDLSGLEVLEMAALRELVRARHVIYGMGAVLALVSPRPDVERLLRLSGAIS